MNHETVQKWFSHDGDNTHRINSLTFCISTYNNLPYLKIAIDSVRKNSFFKNAPFIIHAENCTDGTNEWLELNKEKYNLSLIIEPNNKEVRGIGGGMNICAEHITTEYIMFLHSDFYVTKNWDLELLNIHTEFPNEKLWVNSFRIEPNMFNSPPRYGTHLVSLDMFGAYYYDFNSDQFDIWANEFAKQNSNYRIPKGEGVSGLVKKSVWDQIGGNDPRFAPTSWDDHDLFLRMLQHDIKFVLPASSVVWHFGARGSHRLEENNGISSDRQRQAENENAKKWFEKWGRMPQFDQYGMIKKF
jgi:GT2 family glycosyltransferase